jgi:murein DD-endopeptidase MepM/ murein hydrolase activator NlpD
MVGILGVASAQEQPDPDSDTNVLVHIVQRGETLFRIAEDYNLTTDQIAVANGIAAVDSIQVGQRLLIPIAGASQLIEATDPSFPTHQIKPGETLQSIAEFYGLTVNDLIAWNAIDNPDRIIIGQTLDLVSRTQPPVSETSPLNILHVVQSGETLFGIATTYNVALDAIREVNDLTEDSLIFAGQELIIPGGRPQTPDGARDLPDFITGLVMNPLTLTEGRTGRLQLGTTDFSSVAGTFLGRALNVISQENNTIHYVLLPVPVFTEAGIYPLEISVAYADGRTTVIPLNVEIVAGNYGSQAITLPEDRAELLAPAVESNELDILRNLTSPVTIERHFAGSMSLPAAAAMNAPFGAIRSYNGGAFDRFHSGSDFAGGPGTPVYATAPGRVVLADVLNIRGISVVIDHGWGVYTNYSHLSERLVQLGDFVDTGQIIGTVGNSGRATGAHLHWELWVNGVPVDPMQWVIETFP